MTAGQDASRPLRGLRIVELSSYVASPLAGMTLAQLGADVIRVEPLGGAADRPRWPRARSGTSLLWSGMNKGKRAVEIDLSSPRGRSLVADLAVGGGPRGGILVTNSQPYPELTYETLRRRRPDFVHVQLTGRRDGGTAVDYTVQAATGFPWLTGPPDATGPVNGVLPAWDVAAGLYLTVGLLAAERHRLRTGEGQQVRIALEDVALATAGNLGYLAEAQVATPRRRDGNHLYGLFGRDFTTVDRTRLMIVVLTGRHWRGLLAAAGLTEAVAALGTALGADFDDEDERYRHRGVLAELFADWFGKRTFAEAEDVLNRTPVLWARYRTFAELAADDARLLRSNPLFGPLDQPGVGPHLAPGSPVVMAGRPCPPEASPRVGEHTTDVLGSELGLSADELRELADLGVLRR